MAYRRHVDHSLWHGVLFDVFDAGDTLQGLATVPEFIWELSLGIYCAV